MDQRITEFVGRNAGAAMITHKSDGTSHAVRVGIGLVDGTIQSSGTQTRVRTRYLRRDPRATLFIWDSEQPYLWLTLETMVTLIEGDEATEANRRLFRAMQQRPEPQPLLWQGEERSDEEFLRMMAEEDRLVYVFEVQRAYGFLDQGGLWTWTAD